MSSVDRRLSEETKRQIAERARTLTERLRRPTISGPRVEDPATWLERWRDRLPEGEFDRRLAAFDADPIAALKRHGWPETEPPAWTDDLAELVTAMSRRHRGVVTDVVDDRPFGQALVPMARYAVAAWTDPVVETFSESFRTDLTVALADRLAELYEHVLYVEFETRRRLSDVGYEAFVADLTRDGLASLFKEYSLLARITVRLLSGFAAAASELCDRLRTDAEALTEWFGDGDPLCPTGIEFVGDAHRRCRQVAVVQFGTERVVYKPRGVGHAAGFDRLVSRLADVLPTSVATPTVLKRDGYGWMSYCEPAPSNKSDDATTFYRTAGAMTCLLYALGYTDGFLENIHATGTVPMVLDFETLLSPRGLRPELSPGLTRSQALGTVIETDLLPRAGTNGPISCGAGFGSDELVTESPQRVFTAVNTDEMELSFKRQGQIAGSNLPPSDEVGPPASHSRHLIKGFKQTYRALVRHRDRLRRAVVDCLGGNQTRFLLRPSHHYRTIRKLLAEPSYLRTGLRFGCRVEEFLAPFLATGSAAASVGRRVHRAEETALLDFDIPSFTVESGGRAVETREGRVPAALAESGLERSLSRIDDLCSADRRRQIRLLRLAYGVEPDDDRHHITDVSVMKTADGRHDRNNTGTAASVDIQRQVLHVIRRVVETASITQDGDPYWTVPKTGANGGYRHHTTGPGVYEGVGGVGIFLAGVTDVVGSNTAASLLKQIVAQLRDNPPTEPGGFGYGRASVAYALAVAGDVTNRPAWTNTAVELLSDLSREAITTPETYDVVSGTAGLGHVLAAVFDRTGAETLLTRARWAGETLLSGARTDATGRFGWPHPNTDRVLTGFAHGNHGVAAALHRLAETTCDDRYRRTADRALDAVRDAFDPKHRGWADLRPDVNRSFTDGWCYGRSGVGLAYTHSYDATGDRAYRRTAATTLTEVDGLHKNDHPCCGNCSKIAALQYAAGSIPGTAGRAPILVNQRLAGAQPSASFQTRWGTDHWTDVTFMKGEAGVAYTLLRHEHPQLPTVLAVE